MIRFRCSFVLVFLLAFTTLPFRITWASDFQPSALFPDGWVIAAVTDFNSDKYSDVLLLRPDLQNPDTHSELQLYLWSDGTFIPVKDVHLILPTIVNVIPADFNMDGKVDILVQGRTSDAPSLFYATVYFGTLTALSSNITLEPSYDQLSVVDLNDDLWPDLYGMNEDGDRYIWWNYLASPTPHFEVVQHELSKNYSLPTSLSTPSSVLFADVDGDCAADMIVISATRSINSDTISSKFIEVWLNTKSVVSATKQISYSFHSVTEIPLYSSIPSAIDVDRDGNTDLLYFTCDDNALSKNCNMHIFYNVQKEMCSNVWIHSGSCRSQQDLCESDPNFVLNISATSAPSATHVAYAIGDLLPNGSALFSIFNFAPYSSNNPNDPNSYNLMALPLALRFGDVNINGFPDVLLPIVVSGTATLQLFLNEGCEQPYCTDDAINAGRRMFMPSDTSAFVTYPGAYISTFMDIDNQGVVDVILSTNSEFVTNDYRNRNMPDTTEEDKAKKEKEEKNLIGSIWDIFSVHTDNDESNKFIDPNFHALTASTAKFSTMVLMNSFDDDAYFLTVLVSNGVCPMWCSGDSFPDPRPYGVHAHGMTVKFTVTDLNGDKYPRIGCQNSASAYAPLQTPYQLFGLGRTNNYIEEFFVGIASTQDDNNNMWIAMIPNAQVVVFPYPPLSPADWTMEMFVSPASRLLAICVAFGAILVINMGIVMYFYYKEHKEDEKEKRQNELLFTF